MFAPWQRDLLEECRVARLGTIARGGRPHLVPVCYALAADEIVIAVDDKPKRPGELARIGNIRRDARVTFLADRYDDADWTRLAWVRVEGEARVLDSGDAFPQALAALRRRYRQYEAMGLEASPLIVLRPARVVSWRAEDARP